MMTIEYISVEEPVVDMSWCGKAQSSGLFAPNTSNSWYLPLKMHSTTPYLLDILIAELTETSFILIPLPIENLS
jgi:hypothetical protein